MEPANVLGQCSFPGDRHGQEQRIEPAVIEPFPNIPACGQYQALLIVRYTQSRFGDFALGSRHAATQNDEILYKRREPIPKIFEVILPLGQNNRRTLCLERFQDIIEDEIVSLAVLSQSGVNRWHRRPFRRRQQWRQFKFRRAIPRAVMNATFECLLPSINSMTDRAALHEDDRMMPILARDGRRKTQNKSRF